MEAPEGRSTILAAGLNLRASRERLGLTMRDVESATLRIAERHGNDEFIVSPSRLSDIETKGELARVLLSWASGREEAEDSLVTAALVCVG
jgi:hypothetical protein